MISDKQWLLTLKKGLTGGWGVGCYPVGGWRPVRSILSGVKHTLGGWRGNSHCFTSSLLPFSGRTPQLHQLSLSWCFCQWITGGLGTHILILPSPIRTTQGVKTRAQRGDLHTMIWITQAFYVWPLIFPPFARLGNHHRAPFSARGFPSRNSGLYAKIQNGFSESAITPTEFRGSILTKLFVFC